MTQEEKRICAERLFDEIGLIDDRFVFEASTPYVSRARRTLWRRVLVAAVSVTLTVCIAVGLFAVGMMNAGKGNAPENDMPMGDTVGDGMLEDNADGSETALTLSARLDRMKDDTAGLTVSKVDIKLFSTSPKIIWKYSDEADYRACTISEAQARTLVEKLSKNRGSRVSGEKPDGELEGLWISTGDGRVISPYLELTAGNTGYGELFEYEPEYEPSEDFSEYLCDTIS